MRATSRLVDRAEHDLAALAAGARLDVDAVDAEQALGRALLDVDGLHSRERDLDSLTDSAPVRSRTVWPASE